MKTALLFPVFCAVGGILALQRCADRLETSGPEHPTQKPASCTRSEKGVAFQHLNTCVSPSRAWLLVRLLLRLDSY